MNTVTTTTDTIRVEPRGLDKIWFFTRRLDIPLKHVRGATFDPGANAEPKGMRRPGLHIPGKWAGTFSRHGREILLERQFGGQHGRDRAFRRALPATVPDG